MAVTITTNVNKYTWATAHLTWAQVHKTWADAAITTYTAQVAEALKIAEVMKKTGNHTCRETLRVTEKSSKTLRKTAHETVKLTDKISKMSMALLRKESIRIAEVGKKTSIKSFEEQFGLQDKWGGKYLIVQIAEALKIAETYWDNISFYLNVVENINLDETIPKHLLRPLQEQFAIGDAAVRAIYKNMHEALKIAEEQRKQISNLQKEQFALGDSVVKNSGKAILEQVGLQDKMRISTVINIAEQAAFADEILRNTAFIKVFAEAFNLLDKQLCKYKKNTKERLHVVDKVVKCFGKVSEEEISIMDKALRRYVANRLFNESFDVSEFSARRVGLNKKESIEFYDAFLRACNGVISNIAIREGDMTLESFMDDLDTPPGFTKFMDFKVGEYEYKEALVRIAVKTVVQQTLPSVSDVVMHVDIPDTDDRGTVVITDTSAPTIVYFNKFYYHAPEVNCTLRNGNTGDGYIVPNIVTTEGNDSRGRYFEVELLNANGERVKGTVSWVSKGY